MLPVLSLDGFAHAGLAGCRHHGLDHYCERTSDVWRNAAYVLLVVVVVVQSSAESLIRTKEDDESVIISTYYYYYY